MAKKQTAKKSTAAKPRKKKEAVVEEQEAKVVVASNVDELPNTVSSETCECKWQEQDLIQSKNDCCGKDDSECKCEKHEEEAIREEPSTVETAEPTQEELEEQERERTRQRHKEFMAEMNKVPEKDTREMLDFLGITELPKFTNAESDLWVRAVARVRKKDTSVSWCVLERRGVQKHAITKIFGRCAPIAQVGVPIPIEVMNPRYTAKVNKYNIESVRNYVFEKIGDKAKNMSSEELMDELVRIEIEFYNNSKYFGDE